MLTTAPKLEFHPRFAAVKKNFSHNCPSCGQPVRVSSLTHTGKIRLLVLRLLKEKRSQKDGGRESHKVPGVRIHNA